MNDEQKIKLSKIFAGTIRRAISIDDTLHVIIGTPAELDAAAAKTEKMIQNALQHGKTVRENGVTRWIEKHALHNENATLASERYRWHADGNRVKAQKMLVTKDADGRVRKKFIGYGWTTP